jgi:hypothetical protein
VLSLRGGLERRLPELCPERLHEVDGGVQMVGGYLPVAQVSVVVEGLVAEFRLQAEFGGPADDAVAEAEVLKTLPLVPIRGLDPTRQQLAGQFRPLLDVHTVPFALAGDRPRGTPPA